MHVKGIEWRFANVFKEVHVYLLNYVYNSLKLQT